MPFAVDEIHKLGVTGRRVIAADTFSSAPGSHSRGAAKHYTVPAPTQETEAFIAAVVDIIDTENVTWLLPMFEEVFYLAYHRDRLLAGHPDLELFFPDFPTLHRVHDKVSFAELCRSLNLPVAESITATNDDELRAATTHWEHWFARAPPTAVVGSMSSRIPVRSPRRRVSTAYIPPRRTRGWCRST